MNWTQVEGKWRQLAGRAQSEWAKLSDDDLANIAGKKHQLLGKLQEHYGVLKQDAESQVDKWLAKLSAGGGGEPSKDSASS